MKRLLLVFLLIFSMKSNAGFVADEATWLLFMKDGGYTYFVDPYQTDYLDNGDVEILVERLKDGESKFSENPERLKFNCRSKKSYQASALNADGSWRKVKDYDVLPGSIAATWVRMACGEKVKDGYAAYIATQIKTEPMKQYSVFYWDKDRLYTTSIPDSRLVKVYQWDWGTKESFYFLTVVNCKTKETGVVTSVDGTPESWLAPSPKNSILGFVTFQTCVKKL